MDKKSYYERLEADKAIDLRNNSKVIEDEAGYIKIVPIDPTKLFKAPKK